MFPRYKLTFNWTTVKLDSIFRSEYVSDELIQTLVRTMVSDIVSQCSKRYGTDDLRPAFTSLAVLFDRPEVVLSFNVCMHSM